VRRWIAAGFREAETVAEWVAAGVGPEQAARFEQRRAEITGTRA